MSDSPDTLRAVVQRFGTPVYVYDSERIASQMAKLRAFDRVRFAQKACPNTHILRLLRSLGAAVDCVSEGELRRAVAAGFRVGPSSSEVVYTADVFTVSALEAVVSSGVAVNAGSADMLSQLGQRSPGHRVWLRINPGFGHGHSRKVNTGGDSSKHGIWFEDLRDALRRIDEHQLDLVGLHMHIGSGADIDHLARVCEAMVDHVSRLGRDVRAVSGGGGLSVPYRPAEPEVDVQAYYERWNAARGRIRDRVGHDVELEIEPGRYLVAQAGLLVAEVRATKWMGKNHFTLVDAGFNDLLRPAMYGAHHEISLVPAAGRQLGPPAPTVVAGPLCESGDVFTQGAGGELAPRWLPPAQVGDLLVFHDAGAYGSSMSGNYNSRPLAAEVLLEGGDAKLIRRRQSIDELLALESV